MQRVRRVCSWHSDMVPQLKPIEVRVWDCKHLSWSWVWGLRTCWTVEWYLQYLQAGRGCLDTNIITHQASLRIGIYYLRIQQWPSFPFLSLSLYSRMMILIIIIIRRIITIITETARHCVVPGGFVLSYWSSSPCLQSPAEIHQGYLQ